MEPEIGACGRSLGHWGTVLEDCSPKGWLYAKCTVVHPSAFWHIVKEASRFGTLCDTILIRLPDEWCCLTSDCKPLKL